ncbi:MAG: NUDIX domain-containing protein, partial [Micrococcales bacterium]|nr:NUDIX domain-containing protein [Micrococcales bacterium]
TDLVLPMTYHHYRTLQRRGVAPARLRMYRQFDPTIQGTEPGYDLDIEDPWYGGPADFEAVLDQIEAATPGIVRRIEHLVRKRAEGVNSQNAGDGWQQCQVCDAFHWGVFGAAGLLVHRDGEVLLQLRAARTHQAGTWGLPGGARQNGESPTQAAIRESAEEIGLESQMIHLQWWGISDHQSWSYTTVVAEASPELHVRPSNWETAELRWVPVDQVANQEDLHPGFRRAWPQYKPWIGQQATLIVDAANVVGHRPDGWWKDRPAAATKLRDQLVTLASRGIADVSLRGQAKSPASPNQNDSTPFLAGWWPQIEMVVEGQANALTPVQGVKVVKAPGEGDAEIAARAQLHLTAGLGPVVVATADRALAARIDQLGASVMPPGMLLRAL